MDFETEHLLLIEENEDDLHQIEKALFTKRYSLNKRHSGMFRVQSIAMVYAIWEGFMQKTLQMYIRYINAKAIDFNDLNDSIMVHHMENSFKQLREYPQSERKKIAFFNELSLFYAEQYHELYSYVDTESNLGFEVMNKLLKRFGLETFPEHWRQYTYPNKTLKVMLKDLLRYRNGISHGGDLTNEEVVTQDVYNKYKQLVLDLMYGIHDVIVDAIENETYKKDDESEGLSV